MPDPKKKKKKVVPVAAPSRSSAIMRANKKTKTKKKSSTSSYSNVHTGSSSSDPGVLKAQADKRARSKVLASKKKVSLANKKREATLTNKATIKRREGLNLASQAKKTALRAKYKKKK